MAGGNRYQVKARGKSDDDGDGDGDGGGMYLREEEAVETAAPAEEDAVGESSRGS